MKGSQTTVGPPFSDAVELVPPLISVENVSFSYRVGSPVLKNVSFKIFKGDFAAVTGPSGSGKSTLFYLLGTLARKFEGEIQFQGQSYRKMSLDEQSSFRNEKIGFVFQQFHLLPRASVLENILLPAYYPYATSKPTEHDLHRAREFAKELGIEELLDRRPQELSGGQQQRVAIARALMRDPEIILADEPTGNLDSKAETAVLEIFKKLHSQGRTVVIITHSPQVAEKCDRTIGFRDGEIEFDRSSGQRRHENARPSVRAITQKEWPGYFFLRSLKPAWENIVRSKLKSFLTTLGVVLGIAAVLSTISLGSYAKEKILAGYISLGVNVADFRAYQNWRRSSSDYSPSVFRELSWQADILPLRRIFPEIAELSPVITIWSPTFNFGGKSLSEEASSIGIGEKYFSINNMKLEQGRSFTALDIETSNPVCMIGFEVKNQLFRGQDPIGKSLTMIPDSSDSSEFTCRVVGSLASQPIQGGGPQPDLQVFLPYTYLTKVIDKWWMREIHELRLKFKPNIDLDAIGKQIEGYFRSRYGKSGSFSFVSNTKVIDQMNLFLNVFSMLLTAVALIALVVGGVGINNMMLVNLSERLKELGLRKSLGASPKQIRALLLTESVLLCSLGGLAGLVFGVIGYHGLIFAATKFIPNIKFEWVFEWPALFISLSAVVATGLLSGIIPALRAERLEVIEALRQE